MMSLPNKRRVAVCCYWILSLLLSVPSSKATHAEESLVISSSTNDELRNAWALLVSNGFQVCRPDPDDSARLSFVPSCSSSNLLVRGHDYTVRRRMITEQDEEKELGWLLNLLGALICVCIAALAAGLTLGLLGLDPLMLLIKERAGATEEERARAKNLLPIVKQHHLLLVTLLLMNSIANEALPIFLEHIVSPAIAVILSVTLVLFGCVSKHQLTQSP